MNNTLKNILAIVAGFIIGSALNMGLITLGPNIIPPPAGADVTAYEGLKATIHLFEPQHFIFPFLAHALGTLAGAFTAAKMAAGDGMKFALGIGIFFLSGGIANVLMLPSPAWFNAVDLIFAYIPMAYLAGKWGQKEVRE